MIFDRLDARAGDNERWNAPFGGTFSANVTVASDYSFAGISQTKRGPAFHMGLDYKTAEVSADVPFWLYLTLWGSNIDFPTTGSGVEIDLSSDLKFLAFDRKLSMDFGYIRYFYGLDFNLAYTDTSIEPSGCGNTNYCAGRFFVSVIKVF